MNCKNCYHHELCEFYTRGFAIKCVTAESCSFYKDASLVVELPCNLGDTVYTPECRKLEEISKNVPLTLEQLRNMTSYEEDTAIWIKNVKENFIVRGIVDCADFGIVGLWDTNGCDYLEYDYGNTWLAYRHYPE